MPPDKVFPVYWDSALVAKFYLNEPGRNEVRALARSAGVVVTSALAIAEVSAAFHRKLREVAISRDVFRALQGQFHHDAERGLWRMVGVTEALLQEVQVLFAHLHADIYLRSLDAVHLVTARGEGFTKLYTNDRHLLKACSRLGVEGINPVR